MGIRDCFTLIDGIVYVLGFTFSDNAERGVIIAKEEQQPEPSEAEVLLRRARSSLTTAIGQLKQDHNPTAATEATIARLLLNSAIALMEGEGVE